MSTKLNEIIEKQSIQSIKLHPAKKEWEVIIFMSALIKVGTAAFSIFAGYHWIAGQFSSVGTVLSVVFGFLFVAIIEVLNASFLSKATKMLLYKRWVVSGFLFFASLLIFACSFVISTEGLASWKTSAPREIVESNETKIESSYNQRISDLKTDIETIKKNTWRGKLSIQQESRILALSQQIERLQIEKNSTIDKEQTRVSNEKQKVNSTVLITADKFHKIATVIMCFQFFGNCLLTFFLFVVYRETEGLQTEMTHFIKERGQVFTLHLLDEYRQRENEFFHMLNTARSLENNTFEVPGLIEKSENNNNEKNNDQNKKINVIGFQTKKPQTDNVPVTMDTLNESITTDGKPLRTNSLGMCTCLNYTCNVEFKRKTVTHIYCCKECRERAWEVKTGKPISIVYPKK